jgi:hypothetical protein
MEYLSLSSLIDREIIALNLSGKEGLQLIQYANQTAELGSIHDNRGWQDTDPAPLHFIG